MSVDIRDECRHTILHKTVHVQSCENDFYSYVMWKAAKIRYFQWETKSLQLLGKPNITKHTQGMSGDSPLKSSCNSN